MAQVSGKKLLPIFAIAGVGFFALALYVAKDLGDPARANRERLTLDGGAAVSMMSEEERVEYLKTGLQVEGFNVGPERKPGTEETVPGLLRVEGTIKNVGDRAVHVAHLFVLTKDDEGKVLSTFQQNVLERGALEPGQARSFRFRIPDRPKYKGFDFQLR